MDLGKDRTNVRLKPHFVLWGFNLRVDFGLISFNPYILSHTTSRTDAHKDEKILSKKGESERRVVALKFLNNRPTIFCTKTFYFFINKGKQLILAINLINSPFVPSILDRFLMMPKFQKFIEI